jgi:hypothetical protein
MKLSYSNVVASLALFVSLGGASYAAIALPAHSVGRRELRAGAVDTDALGFPLGVVGKTFTKPDDLSKGACNGGGKDLLPGEPAPPCAPTPQVPYAEGRQVRLEIRSQGQLYVSAVAGLKNEGESGTRADVTLGIVVDGHLIIRTGVTCDGGASVQVPLEALVHVGPGKHTAALGIEAEYHSSTRGDVIVAPVSLVADAQPPAS